MIMIQASGNDIDQTLWKESYANKLPGMGIVALEKQDAPIYYRRLCT